MIVTMSIFHDAYFFDPGLFAADMAEGTTLLPRSAAKTYEMMRSAALESFDTNKITRELADRYGGWDRGSILAELPEQAPGKPEDFAACCLLLLYGKVTSPTVNPSLGLHGLWRVCAGLLTRFGWPKVDSKLLVQGRHFEELAIKWHTNDAAPANGDAIAIWRQVRPVSTASSIGWLSVSDVQHLQEKLRTSRRLFAGLLTTEETQAYQQATVMLQEAQENRTGLCLILSG